MLIIKIEENINGHFNYDIYDSEEALTGGLDAIDGGICTSGDMKIALQSACDMAHNLLLDANPF